ncbi:MAG TPA: chaperonin GroEL [Pyrinomonadaceae bacterium]|jgi:chaperonin GroEL
MAKPKQTVFYSWQSDSPPKANRNFIQTVLTKAIKAINAKESITVEAVLDSDTRNVTGAPKISDTIFTKIDAASIFVADVTIIRRTAAKIAKDRKALPNPNVLVELGYALKVLGDERLVLIANTAFGRIEDLPFDLLGRRTIPYALGEKDLEKNTEGQRIRKQVRDNLQGALETALESIFLLPPRDLNQLSAPLLVLEGAKSLRDKAASTIGPRGGRTAYIGMRDRERMLTRNGLTIADNITNRDLHSREGIDLLSKTAEEIRQQMGDGAKTALLLCYEMVNGAYDVIETNEPLDDVLDGMERAVEKTVGYINKHRKPLNRDEVFNVAKTASRTAAAKLVTEAFERVKSEGILMVEDDVAPAVSSVEIQEGIRFDRGYWSEDFANDPETGHCVLNDCYILLHEGRISATNAYYELLGKIVEAEKSVLILAEDIDDVAITTLLRNKNKLTSVAVKAPGSKDDRRSWLKDIAAITGGQVLGAEYGKKLEDADLSDLGVAERVVVEKDKTQITPGAGNEERIAIRLAHLRAQIEQTVSNERSKLQNRLANLIGNTAVIKAGGATRDALLDNRYNIQTAMSSVHWALAQGYVLGGGLTYYNARQSLERDLNLKSLSEGEKIGIKAVQRALEEPIRCLLQTGRETIEELQSNAKDQTEVGFNLATKRYENLRTAGVWDAARLAASAVQIAFSHARMILETTSWDTIRPNLPFL